MSTTVGDFLPKEGQTRGHLQLTAAARGSAAVPVERLVVSAYRIPTDTPDESDGTLVWNATVLVLVRASAGGETGLGYTYADAATAHLVHDTLADVVHGADVMQNGRIHAEPRRRRSEPRPFRHRGNGRLRHRHRPVGSQGAAAGPPARRAAGRRAGVGPRVRSGGFTSYTIPQLQAQLAAWVAQGIPRVKMKIGRDPDADVRRVAAARQAIGAEAELYVDANGAYGRVQAQTQAVRFAPSRVSWYEEPVYHLDVDGLRDCRDRAPAGMEIAAGEYGYTPFDFMRLLNARAVDVLQADASRCEGITGFLTAAALCHAYNVPLSAHCAPSLHAHVGCATRQLRHVEYFHDHARIEHLLFDGALTPVRGSLTPDRSRPGLGLQFRDADARQYALLTSPSSGCPPG